MSKQPRKPVSQAQERIAALRADLSGLLKQSERAGQTVRRIDEIMQEIHAIQGEQYGSKAVEAGAQGSKAAR